MIESGGHLSLHIEKTAGTSFEKFLVGFYGPTQVFLYKCDKDQLIRSDNLIDAAKLNPLIDKIRTLSGPLGFTSFAHRLVLRFLGDESNIGIRKMPKRWKAIHGHFDIHRFDKLVVNPFTTVILRDPLERAISHFRYWQRTKGVVTHRVGIPYKEDMNFQDFTSLCEMQNYQSKSLGEIPLECFDVVGVTENLGAFISYFLYKKGRADEIKEVPHFNKAFGEADFVDLGIDCIFEKKFKSLNELDYENYNRAKKLCGLHTT